MKGKTEPPKVAAGELWVDPDFTMEMAMEGLDADVEWKRPGVSRSTSTVLREACPCINCLVNQNL